MLLDQDLSAKLGDFGCTREIPHVLGGQSVITIAVVAKSVGYSTPEVDMLYTLCLIIKHTKDNRM